MDAMAAIKQTFFQECEEQLGELEIGLLAFEDGDADPETVNAVFRAVHSIKGGAGAFSLDDSGRASPMCSRPLSITCARDGLQLRRRCLENDAARGRRARRPGARRARRHGQSTRRGAIPSPPNSAPSIPRQRARIGRRRRESPVMIWTAQCSSRCQSVSTIWTAIPRRAAVMFSSASRPTPPSTPRPTRPRCCCGNSARSARCGRHCDHSGLAAAGRTRSRRQPISAGRSICGPSRARAPIREVFEFVDGDCELDIALGA